MDQRCDIRGLAIDDNVIKIKRLLEQHTADKQLNVPAYESQSISLAAYIGAQYAGGITGNMVWKILHVQYLAVDPAFRGHGIGRQLLNKIEQIARQQDCLISELTTMSWQAPQFYIKYGYEVFGELPNCPVEGQSKLYLKKEL